MSGLLERIGWSKRHFSVRLGVSERTVHDWCAGKSEGSGYKAAMAYLGLVVKFLA